MFFSRHQDFCAFSETVLDRLVERALTALDTPPMVGEARPTKIMLPQDSGLPRYIVPRNDNGHSPHPSHREQKEYGAFSYSISKG